MRILFLGNSFTFVNNLPDVVGAMLSCETVSHTRGGARLSEQLNPETEMGSKTLKALKEERWDYVVLQEQSFAPVGNKESFKKSVHALAALIRENGAIPVLYATWAYREGSEKLKKTGLTYGEMDKALFDSYHEAAYETGAIVADAGRLFTAVRKTINPYGEDDYHPSQAGTALAAHAICSAIMQSEKTK